jgi:hypothetical protein
MYTDYHGALGYKCWYIFAMFLVLVDWSMAKDIITETKPKFCMIGLPYCASDHSWEDKEWQDDSDFAYAHLGVGKSATNCLERAAEWHNYCQNSPLEPVQATFTPTGETVVYPQVPDHDCLLEPAYAVEVEAQAHAPAHESRGASAPLAPCFEPADHALFPHHCKLKKAPDTPR